MMEAASTAVTNSYNGELRIEGDDREAQVLMEYDAVYTELLEKGLKFDLELPPLFKKDFIDHGALTAHNRNSQDIRNNLTTVLQFLNSSDLFELLVPTSTYSKGHGYKVNASDPRIPPDIKTVLKKCTENFSTTEGHKSVRRRFLDARKLDPADAKQLAEKVSATLHSYGSWLVKAINTMEKDRRKLINQFQMSFSELSLNRWVTVDVDFVTF